MTSAERAQLTVVVGCAVALTVLLGVLLDWPGWLWVLPGAGLVGTFVLAHNMIAARSLREQDLYGRLAVATRVEPPMEVEQPTHFEQVPLPETALPSALPDYRFLFSATVWWRPGPQAGVAPRANLPAKAVNAILDRALPLLARERPEDCSLARHRLAGQLGEFRQDQAGVVDVSALDVRLSLDDGDTARLATFADTRKDTEVWHYERSHTEDKRRYYHENVFLDAGSAVVWWLIKQGDNVRQTVDDMEALTRLAAATRNQGVALPGSPQPGVVETTDRLMDLIGLVPDGAERTLFAEHLAQAMRAAGRGDEAERLRVAFDLLEPEPPAWTPPVNGEHDTVVVDGRDRWPVEDEA